MAMIWRRHTQMPHLRSPRRRKWPWKYLFKGVRKLYEEPNYTELRKRYVRTFLGECVGIGLEWRGSKKSDPHVCVRFLTEDDGYWSESRNGGMFSSGWLSEMQVNVEAALRWMEQNCERDGRYGWRFKT